MHPPRAWQASLPLQIMSDLFNGPFGVVNIGLEQFAQDLHQAGVKVLETNWTPPPGGDPDLARILSKLADDQQGLGGRIQAANQEAFTRLVESQPVLTDIQLAKDVIPGFSDDLVLHAGPPMAWNQMVGAVRGAVTGGLIYEGLASTPEAAQELVTRGKIKFSPCHAHQAVGPMAGIITAHMPVLMVEDLKHGTRAFATMNEGWGRTLRFGAFDEEVIQRLHWMADVLAPTLRAGISHLGGIDCKAIITRALHMGDECHNRDVAASSLFFKEITPAILESVQDREAIRSSLNFLAQQRTFLPEYRYGGLQGWPAGGREDCIQHDGNRHRAQWNRSRHPGQRGWRGMVYGESQRGPGTLFSGIFRSRCYPGYG
jgi:hypothetical protein